MTEKKKTAAEIYDYCDHVYGTCTDGSFEACLHHEDYFRIKNEESLLATAIKEYEEKKDVSP
jgi:hypothetical protein